MAGSDGSSRASFLARQSPGALSGGEFRQLDADANGTGKRAADAASAVIAVKANPAAKEITGTGVSLNAPFANGNPDGRNSSNSNSESARREAGVMRSIDLAIFAQQQGIGWAKEKPELMKL